MGLIIARVFFARYSLIHNSKRKSIDIGLLIGVVDMANKVTSSKA